ncbi:MAG: tripartite tricarboxylate transporter substrate binding protein [Pseudomonadota bacterium]|nr:tripartite tricarboxylate transporter substrate binding protein [Pseudomonadota bacterium]
MSKSRRAFTLGTLAVLASGGRAVAQGSTAPLRIVVPFPPGGSTDIFARELEQPFRNALGRAVSVENKSGAGGAIALREVARSPADGSVLLVSNNASSVIVPLVQKDAGFDPISDFTPVVGLGRSAMVLIANARLPVSDVRQLIAYAKGRPEGVTSGSGGVGNLGHLAAVLFGQLTGARILHVPYRGQSPLLMATVTGEVQIAFTSASDAMFAFIKNGQLKLLGTGSTEPMTVLPGGVPIARTVPGFSADVWQGLFAPSKMNPTIVKQFNQIVTKMLSDPEVKKRFADAGFETWPASPEQFSDVVAADVRRWKPVVDQAGIRA